MAALEEDTAFVPTAERVYFENAEGIKLCGVLNLRNESKDVVLLCHGVFCDKVWRACTTSAWGPDSLMHTYGVERRTWASEIG